MVVSSVVKLMSRAHTHVQSEMLIPIAVTMIDQPQTIHQKLCTTADENSDPFLW